eukprot:CAMPEP_0175067270 /NCGR_PEP_ID=MMETSP0052_2-20121109/17001_1 /TAXON_ID=51329 ORGANISM="Polytomella parva, Strain SAG 63-3" /NCGR_SAMPLE_ID=MMETSP0052_2 /ASSEMBLY_ACC=CAM_ASM_000194 /LENGTH=356 /DNA_ID=CAMNT_0016334125 /DNA_START=255 /DNA_END=1323 /DNA_ORIENTATION=-
MYNSCSAPEEPGAPYDDLSDASISYGRSRPFSQSPPPISSHGHVVPNWRFQIQSPPPPRLSPHGGASLVATPMDPLPLSSPLLSQGQGMSPHSANVDSLTMISHGALGNSNNNNNSRRISNSNKMNALSDFSKLITDRPVSKSRKNGIFHNRTTEDVQNGSAVFLTALKDFHEAHGNRSLAETVEYTRVRCGDLVLTLYELYVAVKQLGGLDECKLRVQQQHSSDASRKMNRCNLDMDASPLDGVDVTDELFALDLGSPVPGFPGSSLASDVSSVSMNMNTNANGHGSTPRLFLTQDSLMVFQKFLVMFDAFLKRECRQFHLRFMDMTNTTDDVGNRDGCFAADQRDDEGSSGGEG